MATSGTHEPSFAPADLGGGSGARYASAVIIVAGVCALVSSLLTFVCVFRLVLILRFANEHQVLCGYKRKK